jgi:hypothetical protein
VVFLEEAATATFEELGLIIATVVDTVVVSTVVVATAVDDVVVVIVEAARGGDTRFAVWYTLHSVTPNVHTSATFPLP